RAALRAGPWVGAAANGGRRRLPLGLLVAAAGACVAPLLAVADPGVAGAAVAASAAGAGLTSAGLTSAGLTAAGLTAAGRSAGQAGGSAGATALAGRLAFAVAAPALAGVGLVAATRQGTELALVLVVAVVLWDLANRVMGTGSAGGALGAVTGAVTLAPLAVVMESVLAPPFVGPAWAALPGMVAVLAPLGVVLGHRGAPGHVPAFRRLESLALSAPAWAIGVAVLLHR
ncbi:MAG: hypothetical protein ACYDEN_13465, partial [Acidimicrobiales bacterium]